VAELELVRPTADRRVLRERLLIVMCWAWIWGFFWLVVCLIASASVTAGISHSVALPAVAFCLFFPPALFITIGRWFLRCPHCHCVVLVSRRPEHPHALKAYYGRGLAGVIFDIAKNRQFTCLECGYHCVLLKH
jgi:hypothetical protein